MRKTIEAGICGTEIGLPIDRENCESTDVSGVSTPTCGFTKNKEKILEKDIKEKDDKKSNKPKDNSDLVCPECGSRSVNVHNNSDEGNTFYCVDCGHEWSVDDFDENGEDDSNQSREDIQGNIINGLKKKIKEKEQEASKGSEGGEQEVKEGKELSKKFKVGQEYITKGNKTFVIKDVMGNNVKIYDTEDGEYHVVKAEQLNQLEDLKKVK